MSSSTPPKLPCAPARAIERLKLRGAVGGFPRPRFLKEGALLSHQGECATDQFTDSFHASTSKSERDAPQFNGASLSRITYSQEHDVTSACKAPSRSSVCCY